MMTNYSTAAFLAITLGIGACAETEQNDSTNPAKVIVANVPGRHFSSLSIHPDNEKLLLLEQSYEFSSVSKVLQYNLHSKKLHFYELGSDHAYLDARYSPSGKFIVLRRSPNVRGNDAVTREAYASSEIVTMKADGSDLKVIPLSKGLKMSPVMSNDDRHIAYWRATQRPENSKSFASRSDVWEVDLKTGSDTLFSGPYEFFAGGQIQYFSDDSRILVNSDAPMSDSLSGRTKDNFSSWHYEYTKKYGDSYIYILARGDKTLPEPIATGAIYTTETSLDNSQNIYFSGARPKFSFFMKPVIGELKQWNYPWSVFGQTVEIYVFPNGKKIAFIFFKKNFEKSRRTERGLAIFHLEHETWEEIVIPDFKSATPILVKSYLN